MSPTDATAPVAIGPPSAQAAAAVLALRHGRAAWPGVHVSEEVFRAHVDRLGAGADDLSRYGADLYLACGCVQREPAALQALDRQVLPVVERQLRRAGILTDSGSDDLAQRLRIWLIGSQPRLAAYSGRGSLVGWLKVVASRRALRLALRRRPEPLPLDEGTAVRLVAAGADPEQRATRNLFRDELQRALDGSVTALSPHARSILRLHYVRGLTLDAIAELHGVHRATVARWLAATRTTIMTQLRERLSRTVRPTSSVFQSLAASVRDELHLSLDRLLRDQNAAANDQGG